MPAWSPTEACSAIAQLAASRGGKAAAGLGMPRWDPAGGVLAHPRAGREPGRDEGPADREPEREVPLLLVLALVIGPEEHGDEQRRRREQQQPGHQGRAR